MGIGILPVFGRNKEKDTIKWFLNHAGIIEKMSDPLQEAVDATFKKKKNFDIVTEKATYLNKLEKDADVARRKTAALLYEGAFFPVMRSRLYDLSGRTDDIADTIKNVANMLHYLKDKKVPDSLAKILHKLGENAAKSARLIKPSLQALFDDREDFHRLVNEIKDLEEKSDIYQRELFDRILFDKKIHPVAVQIVGLIGHTLSRVCDDAKRVSDTITLLKIMGVA